MAINFNLNGNLVSVDVDPMMPLLWVVRDELGFKGCSLMHLPCEIC